MDDHPDRGNRWLSVSETAVRLGVSSPTVRRWIKGGHLVAAQPGGERGLLRVPESELARLARESRL
jgi:excisionase family DNA binding protein